MLEDEATVSHKFPMANQVWNFPKELVPQPTTHLSLVNHLQAQQFLHGEVYLWLVCPFHETVSEENSSKIQFVPQCSSQILFSEPPTNVAVSASSLNPLLPLPRTPCSTTQKSKPASKTNKYIYYIILKRHS